ncbi:MAG: RagB/SusD family nutrient uptake outer membrane protein [Alistipes sp.]|jgi:hypothetical protein|nr:RagB/SusD family nutrient uptake outer membrane protein [Alistipes sp.]
MKKVIVLIQAVLLVGIIGFSSCSDDFLTKLPPQSISQPQVENEAGVNALVTGCYAWMRGDGIFANAILSDWVFGSCLSDEASGGSEPGDQAQFDLVEQFTPMTTSNYLSERWAAIYTGVSRCNAALEFLQALQAGDNALAAAMATQLEAEIRFLRAWYHFKANRSFRNIPYVMTPAEQDGKAADEIPNDGPNWEKLEADVDFAYKNLADRTASSEKGRASKDAARALYAQIHLYQGDYTAAAPLLDEIIEGEGYTYTLVPNYMDNYSEDTENNSESIFEYQASTSPTNRLGLRLTQAVFSQKPGAGPAAFGWGFYQPTQTLVDAFQVTADGLPILDVEDRPQVKNDMGIVTSAEFVPHEGPLDPRLDHTVARRGIPFMDWGVFTGADWIRSQAKGGPYMTKKYQHYQRNQSRQNGNGLYGDRNFRIYRLAHILLWRAECAVEADDLELARTLVNQVRERAKTGQPVMGRILVNTFLTSTITDDIVDWNQPAANYKVEPYPAGHAAFASAEEARKAVRTELQLEFATEGARFYDLKRWGVDIEVMTNFIASDSRFRPEGGMANKVYAEKNRYWPIPQGQLNIQASLMQDPNF